MAERLITIGDRTFAVSPGGIRNALGNDLSHATLMQLLPPAEKCCAKCAFRAGSEEREDSWHWLHMCEDFAEGKTFLCHQGIPGHRDGVPGTPLRVCAGRAATDGKDILHLCFPAVRREREEADHA